MIGTAWTAPGEGSTAKELVMALVAAEGTPLMKETVNIKLSDAAETHLRRISDRLAIETRTNLRLTGEPLTPYDLERMGVCFMTSF